MTGKKNTILTLGNKEFNKSIIELKDHFNFELETSDKNLNENNLDKYQGFIILEDRLSEAGIKKLIKNQKISKIVLFTSKNINSIDKIEKLRLPISINQINNIVSNNLVKRKFQINSSLKIQEYILDKNTRKLSKLKKSLILTEKEIELIEILHLNDFTKKKEILSAIWKYSDDADTHTVETHIYRLRKKIKDSFNDDDFIKSEKRGYSI
tara:strand:- start:1081 stop:1710 length:630 start_codon:yes stop_codon:yes gene_type:complete